MKKLMAGSCLCLVASMALAGSSNISKKEFGDEWPFTVDKGVLHCSKNEVTFRAGGFEYAVNGSATSAGYASIDPIWKFDTEMLKELAAALETTVEEVKKTSPMRISIGSIINKGLTLCD